MSAPPAAKRARPPALDAAVSTFAAPGLGVPDGLFVLADGTLLVCVGHAIRVLAPSGLLQLPFFTFAGSDTRAASRTGRAPTRASTTLSASRWTQPATWW